MDIGDQRRIPGLVDDAVLLLQRRLSDKFVVKVRADMIHLSPRKQLCEPRRNQPADSKLSGSTEPTVDHD